MTWIIIFIVMFAGAMMPIQAGVNSQLGKLLSNPWQAAFISFLGGFLAITCACLLSGKFFPTIKQFTSTPWYLLIGGLFGCVLVVTAIIFAPKLGATILITSLIAGQLIASVILDHFGWVGFQIHQINIFRVIGILFLLSGVVLIRLF